MVVVCMRLVVSALVCMRRRLSTFFVPVLCMLGFCCRIAMLGTLPLVFRTSPHKQLPCLTLMGLPSGLERTRGVVEHYQTPVQEEQPQRTPADGGPHGGRPLTSKPRRRRVSHLSQAGCKQWTGLGIRWLCLEVVQGQRTSTRKNLYWGPILP